VDGILFPGMLVGCHLIISIISNGFKTATNVSYEPLLMSISVVVIGLGFRSVLISITLPKIYESTICRVG
jgi:hypothetical protein